METRCSGLRDLTNQSRVGLYRGLIETGAKTEHFRQSVNDDQLRKLTYIREKKEKRKKKCIWYKFKPYYVVETNKKCESAAILLVSF